MTEAPNPFLMLTDKPLVAVVGSRAGYLQLAPAVEVMTYADLPDSLLLAARDWAATLEVLGAKRVYWITLSEIVRHLHIHLYPRWMDEEPQGLPLFEQRNTPGQPAWSEVLNTALNEWAVRHQVHLAR